MRSSPAVVHLVLVSPGYIQQAQEVRPVGETFRGHLVTEEVDRTQHMIVSEGKTVETRGCVTKANAKEDATYHAVPPRFKYIRLTVWTADLQSNIIKRAVFLGEDMTQSR